MNKKTVAVFLLIFTSFVGERTAKATMSDLCQTKQQNAASFALAQEIGVDVQNVRVIKFNAGPWAKPESGAVGADIISVKTGARLTKNYVIKTYSVSAKQIGNTDNCQIINTVE